MGQHDLRIITRLVAQHRHEVCCLTAGVHADAGHAATSAGIAIGDVRHVLTDILAPASWRALAHLQIRLRRIYVVRCRNRR